MEEITNLLMDILILCSNNKVDFMLTKDGNDNYVKFNERNHLIINTPNHDDLDALKKLLSDKLIELQQLFK